MVGPAFEFDCPLPSGMSNDVAEPAARADGARDRGFYDFNGSARSLPC